MQKTIAFITVLLFGILSSYSCSTVKDLPRDIPGTYYGFLPCADCPGISYTLKLKKNGNYQLTMDYYDRDAVHEEESQYKWENGQIRLYQDGRITGRFAPEGDRLYSLDADGNRIESPLAPYYILYKNQPERAEMPEELKSENDQSLFRGTGNEPFWGIEITEDNEIRFKGLMEEELDITVPITGSSLSRDAETITYTGESGGNSLQISVTSTPCQDDMSGFYFQSRVRVSLERNGRHTDLNGCGQYQNRYVLNGNWSLSSIDESMVPEDDKAPTLSLHLAGAQVSGFAGCNRYFGSITKVDDRTISFGPLGATQMACQNLEAEGQFLDFINHDEHLWTVTQSGSLILSASGSRFEFQRTGA